MSVLLQSAPSRPTRSRRTCHSVPGSSEKFLAKAPSLAADQIFLDLEDSVARGAKAEARGAIIQALNENDWASGPQKTIVYRVNGTDTPFYYRDLIDVVEAAGDKIDAVMLPKVQTPGDIEMTCKLLSQIEMSKGWELGRIGIEAQIEDAKGLIAAGAPAGYPGDHLNYLYSKIVVAARAAGIQAIDGPYAAFKDEEGLKVRTQLVRALGLDGKWTIHPAQIDVVNAIFTPSQEQYDHAEGMLAAYEEAADRGDQGAAIYDGEMIDEANRKMAERLAKAGRAAGLTPSPTTTEA